VNEEHEKGRTPMELLGIGLIVTGVVVAAAGAMLTFHVKIPYVGKLPGDLHVKRDGFELYIPLASGIILSLLASGILWLISYWGRK
jgi:hypothetical protein